MPIDSSIIYTLAEEQLNAGERVRLAFGGDSMLPTLCETDTIVLEPLTDEPHLGDVLLFHHMGHRVVHRLVAVKDGLYILQGDNNLGTEQVHREDLLARVISVKHCDGREVASTSRIWRRNSRWRMLCSSIKRLFVRWFGRDGRRQLRPWYFVALAILMWAPMGGVPLDNYMLGLRMDHLLHASVFLPCALFLYSPSWRKWVVWLTAIGVGVTTESVQALLPYRGFDINDMIANFLGVTLGFAMIILVRRGVRRRHQYPVPEKRGGCR